LRKGAPSLLQHRGCRRRRRRRRRLHSLVQQHLVGAARLGPKEVRVSLKTRPRWPHEIVVIVVRRKGNVSCVGHLGWHRPRRHEGSEIVTASVSIESVLSSRVRAEAVLQLTINMGVSNVRRDSVGIWDSFGV